jgi:hypothetical protein
VVDNLSKENLPLLYEKLLPKIEHNFHNWKNYAVREHEKMIAGVKEFLC